MTADDPARDGAISPETARRLCNAATVVLGRVQLAQRRRRRHADPAGLDRDLAAIEAAARDLVATLPRRARPPAEDPPDA